MTADDWRRVTRRFPCPVCGGTGWCAVSTNGQLCLCMRTDSEWPAKRGMGGFFHRLSSNTTLPSARRTQRRPPVLAKKRGEISDWILDQLSLEQRHLDHLRGTQRRLRDEQVERRRYRTWPGFEGRAELALRAVKEFGAWMRGYPGFHLARGGRPAFVGAVGLLLPVADGENNTIAFQVRPDNLVVGKRIWLSSRGRRQGTGSGAPAHFSRPHCVRDEMSAYLVEGVLSADICSDALGSLCVGLSGKTNWRGVDAERLKSGLVERTIIALDEDQRGTALSSDTAQLAQHLSTHFEVQFARWDGTVAKGFDDCLASGAEFVISALWQ